MKFFSLLIVAALTAGTARGQTVYPIRISAAVIYSGDISSDTNAWAAYGVGEAFEALESLDVFEVDETMESLNQTKTTLNFDPIVQSRKRTPYPQRSRFRVLALTQCDGDKIQATVSVLDTSELRYLKKETVYKDKISHVQRIQEKIAVDFLSAVNPSREEAQQCEAHG